MGVILIDGSLVEVPFPTRRAIGIVATKQRKNSIRQIILHHDACTSADSCARVLAARGLSTHFAVDNDGTVVQLADPAALCWHCIGDIRREDGGIEGRKSFNHRSIGIDISNAVLPKYGDKYHPPREERHVTIHGQDIYGLMPYPCQVEATLALVRVLRHHYHIPADTRTGTAWLGDLRSWTPGVYGHLHVARGKIDPFGFPFVRLTEAT